MKIVVLGCGAVLEQYHKDSLEFASTQLNCDVSAFVDPNPERLAKTRIWFPKAKTYDNAKDCFAEIKDVKLTVITSPPPYHADHAQIALASGSHVLCEKPLAGSVQDSQRIVDSERESGRVVSLGMTRRYFPCFAEAKRRIVSGELGTDLQFIYREGAIYRWPVASAAPFHRSSSGGGVLLDKGVHVLDILGFLFGEGEVRRHFDDGQADVVEANSLCELEFERAKGTMQLSWDMNLSNGMLVSGSKADMWLPNGPMNSVFTRARGATGWNHTLANASWPIDLLATGGQTGCPTSYLECFRYQLVQTLRAADYGEATMATAAEGLATMKIISAAFEMAAPLDKPWLSDDERNGAREVHWRAANPVK